MAIIKHDTHTAELTGQDLADYLMARFNQISDDEPEPCDDEEPTQETVTEAEALERYDEMLDECYPEVSVCGYTYAPSYALKELDPIAYRCGFSDFCSDLESEHNIIVE